ncbi:MAG TPA: hypothetical protein VFB72_02790 [Verrucomicrobiae bacterium]|nr:hypothetical protein [Verrucomicrobiae bacterium]
MQLTKQQILALAEAITGLDGQHLTQNVEGKVVSIFRSYRLAHTARWALARIQGCLRVAIDDFNRAKDALIAHHSNGAGVLNPQHANFAQFVADLEKLKQEAIELHLDQINLADLKLEENEKAGHELPIAVLTALQPLIKAQ